MSVKRKVTLQFIVQDASGVEMPLDLGQVRDLTSLAVHDLVNFNFEERKSSNDGGYYSPTAEAERILFQRENPVIHTTMVLALLGRKIDAIKVLRKERNLGLKESKDAVEAFIRTVGPHFEKCVLENTRKAPLVDENGDDIPF